MSEYIKAEYGALAKNELIQNNRASMLASGYTDIQLDMLPPKAIMGIACGNPTSACDLQPGMKLLDLGCGVGTDVILGGLKVMPGGLSIGLDFLPEMITRAKACAAECTALDESATDFYVQDIGLGKYDFDNNFFDYVISNCCICLVNQNKVFPEVFRVLKPGVNFVFCEEAYKAEASMPPELDKLIKEAIDQKITPISNDSVASIIFRIYVALAKNNAIEKEKMLELLRQTGFESPQVVHETPQLLSMSEPLEMESDRLSNSELQEYTKCLEQTLKKFDVNDYMTFVTIKAQNS
ncbi:MULTISPECIES: methyltransferase domain-containing protein [unclassified Moorena]|uniref:methyltransferase domain-containing protein n=1 Tax=unclassified Moorena TaxID=2683338 RepID=UPI0013C6A6E9|nr:MULTISPECIES: methyltransferase domain-containing protein [unclassified Moorena]NEO15804.1 methyltransferase domain-containing protein [Moorena sp. SIO3E8]NEO21566.1 methyltransferase domain-containing protein [Moorena sp. SIO4A5]NEQ01560.1 methyltransferase domain-containing protein [Moorena sp. SIO3F7]NEQ61083.1 methyltransferase domain-containing protein [Moorena sp. SIO4A1]